MTITRTGLAAGVPPEPLPLEAKILAALRQAISEDELSETIKDAGDLKRVRRRHLIAAVLDAVFNAKIHRGYSEIISELSAARRDFRHDCDRLDNGIRAELCLAPISKVSATVRRPIGADRKLLIKALAAIDLGHDHQHPNCRTLVSRINLLAKNSGYSAKSLATYRSQMETSITAMGSEDGSPKSEFSNDECEYFLKLLSRFGGLATSPGMGMNLMLPAIRGLKKARIPKPGSKNRSPDILVQKSQE